MTTLLSFLGTGKYEPVAYEWHDADGPRQVETRFVCHALAEKSGPNCKVVVVATEGAWTAHGTAIEELLPDADRLVIPEGKSPEQLWEIFKILEARLRQLPETEPVVLDVTHGFRAQPIFVMSMLAHLRATGWTNELSVMYGAFDARREGTPPVAPLWDLTSVVEVVEWALGLQILLETGRVGPISSAVARLGSTLAKNWAVGGRQGERPSLDQLAKSLESFGADLETVRLGSLLGALRTRQGRVAPSSVLRLRDTLAANRALVRSALPVLDASLDRLEALLVTLDGKPLDTLASDEGHRRLVALATVYRDLGRYAETMVVAREGRVLRHSPPAAGRPGPSLDLGAQKLGERRVSKDHDPVVDARNDLQHGGLRLDPKPAKTIRDMARDAVRALAETPAEYDLATADDPVETRVVANVSNHPSEEWPEAMRTEVVERWGDPVDIAVPELTTSTESDDADADASIDDTVRRVLATGARVALVFGEPVFCFGVVRALAERGVRSYAPIGGRAAETLPDGRLARTFTFAGLRPYPTG